MVYLQKVAGREAEQLLLIYGDVAIFWNFSNKLREYNVIMTDKNYGQN